MKSIYLTDLVVSQLLCPPKYSHKEFFDSETTGFYADVLRSGTKSYRVRTRVRGKVHVVTLGDCKELQADQARTLAEEVLRKAKNELSDLFSENDVRGPTIQEFFENKYLPYIKSYKRSWGDDESLIRVHIVPELGGHRMATLKAPDVAVFVDKMKAKKYAPGTINRTLVLLRYGYTLSVRWNMISGQSNPMKEFKNIVNDNKLEHFLTSQQASDLLKELKKSDNEMLQWIVLFLLYTGARKREVLDAKWADIDLEQKSWRIPKTKSGKIRHIPLSEHAIDVLISVKKRWGKEAFPFIFANEKTGLPFVSFFCSWNRARKLAGLSYLRVHDLRHSFASFLVNAGRSLYEVQEILGHSDIRTTSRYAHLSRERLQQAVEVVPLVK
jgi:integrase